MNRKILATLSGVIGVIVLLFALGFASSSVSAQDGNLLQDGGFEGSYVGRGRPDLNTSAPWLLYNADGPRNFEWQNRADKVYAFPHRGGPEVHSGTLSQNINGGYVTFTVAVYQTVNVPANTAINGSIWARIKTCNIGTGLDNCGSAVESGAYVKVGIDTTGGTNPFAPTVAWSNNIAPHDSWQQASVSVTTGSTPATFFAFFTQASPSQLNNVWFDDAYMGTGGPGGAPAAPPAGVATAVPTARPVPTAFVAFRQMPRPDGSQYHIIQPGDTLTGISTAYNISIERIMEQNNLRSSRFIFVGQELLIFPAGSVTTTLGTGGARLATNTPRPTMTFSADQLGGLNSTPGPTPFGF